MELYKPIYAMCALTEHISFKIATKCSAGEHHICAFSWPSEVRLERNNIIIANIANDLHYRNTYMYKIWTNTYQSGSTICSRKEKHHLMYLSVCQKYDLKEKQISIKISNLSHQRNHVIMFDISVHLLSIQLLKKNIGQTYQTSKVISV